MAMVTSLDRDDREFKSAHPTKLVAKYLINENSGLKVLQINTYGSAERDVPGKLSQTLQFNEQSAKQLFDILKNEYGF